MKLYVVSADSYESSYGCDISIFGIYSSNEQAENAIKELNKKNDHIRYNIDEMNLNETKEVYLGGYYE